MKEPISIKEILAVVIKRGRLILCVALIIAIVAGALKCFDSYRSYGRPENVQAEVDIRNQALKEEYEIEKNRIEVNIVNAEKLLNYQQEYNTSSLLMQIDPYNKHVSNMLLAITDYEETATEPVYQKNGTPVSYIAYQIQQQYIAYWETLNLQKYLPDDLVQDVELKYVKELITVTAEGGVITVSTSARDEETAKMLCEIAYTSIIDIQESIADVHQHTLRVVSESYSVEVDSALLSKQEKNIDKIETYENNVEKQRKALKNLEKPVYEAVYSLDEVVKDSAVFAVLGYIVGFLLACICVWLKYILNDSLETSRQMESALAVPYLGNAEKSGSMWNRAASRFVGERVWNDQSQALQYIVENIKSRVSCQKCIAMVSTLPITEKDSELQCLLSAVKDLGYNINFVNQAEANPAAIASIRNADYVILVERLSVSNRKSIRFVMELAGQFETAILGFITA